MSSLVISGIVYTTGVTIDKYLYLWYHHYMSKEQIQTLNQPQTPEVLSPEMQVGAALQEKVVGRGEELADNIAIRADGYDNPLRGHAVADASVGLANEAKVGISALRFRYAKRAAQKHYRKNKDAYHEQAITDARSEGVDLHGHNS